MKRVLTLALVFLSLVPILWTAGCSSGEKHDLQMAPASSLPAKMQSAQTRVREAYQFAAANPAALQSVPCYCGCVGLGHTSNYACYVKGTNPEGTIVFDEHALNCVVCVDITQDVMRLTGEGRSAPEIERYVVSNYSRFGPPTR